MGRLARSGVAEAQVSASPEQVWAVLTDIARTGDWSHEATGGEWLGGATRAEPGARFRGRNRQGRARWSRRCEVLEAEAPYRFRFRTIPTHLFPDSTVWTFEIQPLADGARITQHFEVVKLPRLLDLLFYATLPAHRDRSQALHDDLVRLGGVAAAAPARIG